MPCDSCLWHILLIGMYDGRCLDTFKLLTALMKSHCVCLLLGQVVLSFTSTHSACIWLLAAYMTHTYDALCCFWLVLVVDGNLV